MNKSRTLRVGHAPLRILKMAIGVGLLAYLIFQTRDSFSRLIAHSPRWPYLVAALLLLMCTVMMSFVRWHLLVRALGIDVRLRDSLRLGSLGYALNYVSLGTLGGDVFKALLLVHAQPNQRAEAVATVLADRLMGLVTSLCVASAGIIVTGVWHSSELVISVPSKMVLISTAIALGGFGLFLISGHAFLKHVRALLLPIPFVGQTLTRLLDAVYLYHRRRLSVLTAFLVSLVMALGLITHFYLVGYGLRLDMLRWIQHLVVVPTAGLVGTLPLTPSGLGTIEFALEALYNAFPSSIQIPRGSGTLLGLGVRFLDLVVATACLVMCFRYRKDFQTVKNEFEAASDSSGGSQC